MATKKNKSATRFFRPARFTDMYKCSKCDSQDTVALAKGVNTLIWCRCGVVTVENSSGVKEVHNFIKPTTAYYTQEEYHHDLRKTP